MFDISKEKTTFLEGVKEVVKTYSVAKHVEFLINKSSILDFENLWNACETVYLRLKTLADELERCENGFKKQNSAIYAIKSKSGQSVNVSL